jgi:ferredoxin-type protein NapH
MSTRLHTLPAMRRHARPTIRAILASLPMLLLTAFLLVGSSGGIPASPTRALPLLLTFVFVNTLFFLMMKTGRTDRYRAALFITMAVAFVLSFVSHLVELRGSMSLSEEDILRSHAPFCHMVIPMTLIPAALTKTIIFPGQITGGFANISSMFVIWIGATVTLGRGFCSWGCFYGGLEDGISRIRRRPLLRRISSRWTYAPYAVLAVVVILSAASLAPFYCEWLCPFKAVTEYEAVTNLRTAVQATIFMALFLALVVVLPFLSKRRAQCGLFCPMGAFQGLSNKLNLFKIRVDREACTQCNHCVRACPTFSIDESTLADGKTRISCSKCGKCVDECPKGALDFHIQGTSTHASSRKARLLYLYPAFLFLVTLSSGMIQDAIRRVMVFASTGSLLP